MTDSRAHPLALSRRAALQPSPMPPGSAPPASGRMPRPEPPDATSDGTRRRRTRRRTDGARNSRRLAAPGLRSPQAPGSGGSPYRRAGDAGAQVRLAGAIPVGEQTGQRRGFRGRGRSPSTTSPHPHPLPARQRAGARARRCSQMLLVSPQVASAHPPATPAAVWRARSALEQRTSSTPVVPTQPFTRVRASCSPAH